MNVPPPGRPKAGQFKPGEGEADEPARSRWRNGVSCARHGRVTWERVVSGPGLATIHVAADPLPGLLGALHLAGE